MGPRLLDWTVERQARSPGTAARKGALFLLSLRRSLRMKLLLHGVHVTLTPALKKAVRAHLLAAVERFAEDEAADLQVHLCDSNGPKGGLDKECRVTLRLPNLPPLHFTERSENLYKSIQLAHDRLMNMAKRRVDRRRGAAIREARRPYPPGGGLAEIRER
jgi:ribosome-associated translation inhibitor RaiA